MKKLKQIVNGTDTPGGRLFDWCVLLLIVVSIIEFSIETVPGLGEGTIRWLSIAEVVITLLFTIEYVLRVTCADRKLGYIFSFYGLIDLLAILPFYLALGIDIRAIRAFRLLRVVRLLKLARYSTALDRLRRAFIIAREEIILFLLVTGIVLYLSAVGIYYFEHEAQPERFASIFHSIWWAVTSLTTVGYGDAYPITVGGKVFTFVVLMLGLGVVAVPPGLIATALVEARGEEHRKEET